jgi:hypothetical protein
LLGLSLLDYTQRYAVIGGVLGRPLLVTNLFFLSISFFASLSSWRHNGRAVFLLAAFLLGPLQAAFGIRLFKQPPPGGHGTGRNPA